MASAVVEVHLAYWTLIGDSHILALIGISGKYEWCLWELQD
jgi:hypothetical protein